MKKRPIIFSLLCSAAACGGDTQPSADAVPASADAARQPRETVTVSRQLMPGELAEAVLHGSAGDSALLRLTAAGATFDWNIHGHAGGITTTIAEDFAVTETAYRFAPAAEADWYLLVRNSGTTAITIGGTIELYAEMMWSGWL